MRGESGNWLVFFNSARSRRVSVSKAHFCFLSTSFTWTILVVGGAKCGAETRLFLEDDKK
jgi:hypothetical protein